MNEKEYHDLLIRLDTTVNAIKDDVKGVSAKLDGRPCATNTEKIKTLEKITWGAFLVAIIAIAKSFWSVIAGPGTGG